MSRYREVKRRALQAAQPLTAMLELTYRCNWRCVFCYNPRHYDRHPLTLEEWLVVLDDLKQLGTLFVTVTGGEPLTHPQFFEIAEEIKKRCFSLEIFTNGSLVDEKTASRIAELGPAEVEMSLHGATAETHDRTTRQPGSFEAVWRAAFLLRRKGVSVKLKTPVSTLNLEEVEALLTLTSDRGFRLQLDGTITPRDDGDPSPLRFRVEAGRIESLMQRLALVGQLPGSVERENGGINCGLGRIILAVDPEGNVYPCLQWRKSSLGNVRNTRLVDLWHGSAERQAAAEAASTANEKLHRLGGALSSFPFCPAMAERLTGDPTSVSEWHARSAEAARKWSVPAPRE